MNGERIDFFDRSVNCYLGASFEQCKTVDKHLATEVHKDLSSCAATGKCKLRESWERRDHLVQLARDRHPFAYRGCHQFVSLYAGVVLIKGN